MITISVCMIVKNEEDVLARCLDCVKQFADEIILVDTGSSDKTKEIAQRYTNCIYDYSWCDDFASARNFSFSKATKDYCMWIDADDIVTDENIEKIKQLKKHLDPNISIVMMKYHSAYDEQGVPTFSYYRERLMKREARYQWEGVIHEVIALRGRILYQDIAISHKKLKQGDRNRNLRIFEAMLHKGRTLSPRETFYYARELYDHERYDDAVRVFRKFLDDKEGWIENNIDACEMMGYCYYHLHDEDHALLSFFQSFLYDQPRGELCCDIGKHFFDRMEYKQAAYWYEQARACTRDDTSGAFVRKDCYDYIPCIQLCVCYYRLGDEEKAKRYNELAGTYKRTKEVEANDNFFHSKE